jgi:hypothetical protein
MARYSLITLMCPVLAQALAKRCGFIFSSGVHNSNNDNLSGPLGSANKKPLQGLFSEI